MTQETEDVVAVTQNALWNEIVDMILDWEDNGEMAADLASKIIAHVQAPLSDRIDVLARERDHWKNECKALCDVVSEHTKARAALHQEGIEPSPPVVG